jgi:hypothetical protein
MSNSNPATPPPVKLPKGALTRIVLAHSFAEYDPILQKQGVFVETPAARAAFDGALGKCIFVGRRGSGKTAINLHLSATQRSAVQLYPRCLISVRHNITTDRFEDTRQRPFHSLVLTFKMSLVLEAVGRWIKLGLVSKHNLPEALNRERTRIEQHDFDSRTIDILEEVLPTLEKGQDKNWFKWNRKLAAVLEEVGALCTGDRWKTPILIDKIDDDWDGADESVVVLMGLMHACVELTAILKYVRPLLFLRENLFERVRRVDNEFTRLETSVSSLDWTKELLTDLVAKRLQFHMNPKPPLPQVWGAYFEQPADGADIRDQVFDHCQYRPRDVLTYLHHAIESSKGQKHEQIMLSDLGAAKRVFSENRLKDLGNEYSENYPNIHQVLARFHGLARRFTVNAITDLIKKLLADQVIKQQCATWMYSFTAPHQFIELLYSIGFIGVENASAVAFRGSGIKEATAPFIETAKTLVVVHPSYVPALDLQDTIATNLDTSTPLQTEGTLVELPDAISPTDYQSRLQELQSQLDTLPSGEAEADTYHGLVGDLVKYCFFHALGHHATQIVWECKNYEDLKADDFQQLAYYMNVNIGTFIVVSFRGQDADKPHYFQHIRRIAGIHPGCVVIILTDADLKAFLRQASRGGVKDGLLRDRYDTVKQKIS